jgi:hypothetical protein
MLDERSGAVFEAEMLERARESSAATELGGGGDTVDDLQRSRHLGPTRRMTLPEFIVRR